MDETKQISNMPTHLATADHRPEDWPTLFCLTFLW